MVENVQELHNGRKVAINLPLFRRLGLYQLFDPNSSLLLGYNIHLVIHTALASVSTMIIACSIFGMIYVAHSHPEMYNLSVVFKLLFIYIKYMLSSYKLYVLCHNATRIWKFLDIACVDFLADLPVNWNTDSITRTRISSKWFTNYYCAMFTLLIICTWLMLPVVYVYYYGARLDPNSFLLNVCDLFYPISVAKYNEHFYTFYCVEVFLAIWIVYTLMLFDVFLISFCWVISTQYETITTTAAIALGFDENANEYEQMLPNEILLSIIKGHQKVYLKMSEFYSMIRRAVLIQVADSSSSLVFISYLIIMALTSNKSTQIEVVKFTNAFVTVSVQLFLYCYFTDLIRTNKESFNFGLYSCNWIHFNIHFKKMILLTMYQNNANSLKIQASPMKIINLELFLAVIRASYSVLSVMKNSKLSSSSTTN